MQGVLTYIESCHSNAKVIAFIYDGYDESCIVNIERESVKSIATK